LNHLTVIQSPASPTSADGTFGVTVELRDVMENVVASDNTTQVSISVILGGPLTGTATVTAASGVATFTDLKITTPGQSTFTITATGAIPASTLVAITGMCFCTHSLHCTAFTHLYVRALHSLTE
jgi:hypothetical protein